MPIESTLNYHENQATPKLRNGVADQSPKRKEIIKENENTTEH